MGVHQTPLEQSTEIQKFYEGKKIFLTGGSGFLGKLLIEKLLRTCQNVEKIYLLLREKKGVSPKDRLKNMFNSPVSLLLKFTSNNYFIYYYLRYLYSFVSYSNYWKSNTPTTWKNLNWLKETAKNPTLDYPKKASKQSSKPTAFCTAQPPSDSTRKFEKPPTSTFERPETC